MKISIPDHNRAEGAFRLKKIAYSVSKKACPPEFVVEIVTLFGEVLALYSDASDRIGTRNRSKSS